MEKETVKHSIIKNSFWGFCLVLSNRVGALIFSIILARFLLPEGYGIYTIALSIAMIFFTFADLGINNTSIRYLSLAFSKEKKKISAYFKYLLKLKLTLAFGSALILFILAYPLGIWVYGNPVLFLTLIITSFYIFVLSVENFFGQIFYVVEKVSFINLKEVIHQVIRIALTLSVFFIFTTLSYRIYGVFFALILSSILILIFVVIYSYKLIPELYKKSDEEIDKKRVRKFLGYLTIASISTIFFSYIDSLMLGIFVTPEFVGYYRASFSLIFGILALVSFPNLILLPILTKLQNRRVKRVTSQIFKYLAIISIPVIFLLLLLGRFIIRFLFGFEYLPAVFSLYVLAFLIFPAIVINLFLLLFSAKEKPEVFAKLIIITCGINIILNFVFIKIFLTISPLGATVGAALATVISWMIYFILATNKLKEELKIRISFKPVIKPLIVSIIMGAGLYLYIKSIKDMNLFLGILGVVLSLAVYVGILTLIDKELRKELKDLRKTYIGKQISE